MGGAFGEKDVQQRVMITAVAAAASDPRRQMVMVCMAAYHTFIEKTTTEKIEIRKLSELVSSMRQSYRRTNSGSA